MLKNRTLVLLAAAALAGCGGSSGGHRAAGKGGTFKVSLTFPVQSRLVPIATNSVLVSIIRTDLDPNSTTVVDTITFLRSETSAGSNTVTKTNSKVLPTGTYRLEAKAYSDANLSGTPIAAGQTLGIPVTGGDTTQATVTMASALTQLRVTLTDLTTGGAIGAAGGYVINSSGIVSGGAIPVLPVGDQVGFQAVPAADGTVAVTSPGDLVLLPANATGLGSGIFSADPSAGLRFAQPDNAVSGSHTVLKGTLVGTVFGAAANNQTLTFTYLEPSTPPAKPTFVLPVQTGPFNPGTISLINGLGSPLVNFATIDAVAVVVDPSTGPETWALTTSSPLPGTKTLTRVQGSTLVTLTTTATSLAAAGVLLGDSPGDKTVSSIDRTTAAPSDSVTTPLNVTLLSSSDYDENLASTAANQRLYSANVSSTSLKIVAIDASSGDLTRTAFANFTTDNPVAAFAVGRNVSTGGQAVYTVERANATTFFVQRYVDNGSGYVRDGGAAGFGSTANDDANDGGKTPVAVATAGDAVWVAYSDDLNLRVLDSTGARKAIVALTGLTGDAGSQKVAHLSVAGRRVSVSYTYKVGAAALAGIATFTY